MYGGHCTGGTVDVRESHFQIDCNSTGNTCGYHVDGAATMMSYNNVWDVASRLGDSRWLRVGTRGTANSYGDHIINGRLYNLGTFTCPVLVDEDARVGVGTTAPSEKVHIVGSIKIVDGSEGEGKVLTSDDDGVGSWQEPAVGWHDHDERYYTENELETSGLASVHWGNLTNVPGGFADGVDNVGAGDNLGNHIAAQNVELNGYWLSGDGGDEGIHVAGDGKVGVGTTSPGAELEVNGQVKITGGSPGAGKVLTSDASGLGSWQNRIELSGSVPAPGAIIKVSNTGSGHGVYGHSKDDIGVCGFSISKIGVQGGSDSAEGVYGMSNSGNGVLGMSESGYAGYFVGKVNITGNLTKGSGSFKIDHPLEPESKYLQHSFVESPDMMNVYNGNATLDENGQAVVQLPEYFEALNRDFRYQLTCIGGFAPVYIAEKISDNCFKIAGGKSGMEVSWQVTGVRHDPYAVANRIQVEEEKPDEERGYYLHAKAYGLPEEKGVETIRNPWSSETQEVAKEDLSDESDKHYN